MSDGFDMTSSHGLRGRGVLAFALLVGLAAVPLAANFLVFKPRNAEIAQARSEIAAKQARLTTLRELTARIGDLGREIDARRTELALLEERLPDSEGLDGLLKEITRIAQRVALSVRTVRGDKPLTAGAAMEVPLALVVEGDFASVYDFVLALESLPRITRIQSMKVTLLGADPHAVVSHTSTGPRLRGEISLSVYFGTARPPAAAVASANSGGESR